MAADPIVAAVIADLERRSAAGIEKYGTTLAGNPLTLERWLQHAYEEALDLALYLRRAMTEGEGLPVPDPLPPEKPTICQSPQQQAIVRLLAARDAFLSATEAAIETGLVVEMWHDADEENGGWRNHRIGIEVTQVLHKD